MAKQEGKRPLGSKDIDRRIISKWTVKE